METKYLLVQWPESQSFIGVKGCYYVSIDENDDLSMDQAMFVPEEIFNETFNTTATSKYIRDKLNDTEQIIKQSVSKLLIDTSEEQPLGCEIVIEPIEAVGLSSLLLLCIDKIWQDPSEGWIRFTYEGSNTINEFDSLELNEMLQVLEYLEYENSNKGTSK